MIKLALMFAKYLSALVVVVALTAAFDSPVAAQAAKRLKCKGCVKSKQVKNGSLKALDLRNEAGGDFDVTATSSEEVINLPTTGTVLRSVSLTAPSAGQVIVNASLTAEQGSSGFSIVRCFISKAGAPDPRTLFAGKLDNASSSSMTLATTWGEAVAAGTQNLALLCGSSSGTTIAINPALTVIFLPTRY